MISIQGQEFLLAAVGGGHAIHLVAQAPPTDPRRPRRTLCGREWTYPAEPDASPSCRRCLTSIDRLFPDPPRDPRTDLIASLVVDALEEHGLAEVVGVPGDQMAELRRTVHQAIKSRLGYPSNTHVHESRLIVDCRQAYSRHAGRRMDEAAAVMNALVTDAEQASVDDSGWRIRWSAWG
jgi:hypothetical protein